MLSINLPDHQKSGLIFCPSRDFEQIRVVPEALCLHEVEAVFASIGSAFLLVPLEPINCIYFIPFLYFFNIKAARPRYRISRIANSHLVGYASTRRNPVHRKYAIRCRFLTRT